MTAALLALALLAAPDTVTVHVARSAVVAPIERPAQAERDAWLAEDKLKHFFTSFAVTAFGYSGLRAIGADRDAARWGGVGAGLVAGVGKELHDRRDAGPFSVRDLVWDVAGVAVGYFVSEASR